MAGKGRSGSKEFRLRTVQTEVGGSGGKEGDGQANVGSDIMGNEVTIEKR